MVMKADLLDATFAALADPTRRAILARLASGEATVTELAEPFDMSQPAISKHLKVLERAGLIVAGQDAQRRPRKLEPKPLAEAPATPKTAAPAVAPPRTVPAAAQRGGGSSSPPSDNVFKTPKKGKKGGASDYDPLNPTL